MYLNKKFIRYLPTVYIILLAKFYETWLNVAVIVCCQNRIKQDYYDSISQNRHQF